MQLAMIERPKYGETGVQARLWKQVSEYLAHHDQPLICRQCFDASSRLELRGGTIVVAMHRVKLAQ